jgi:fructokinase
LGGAPTNVSWHCAQLGAEAHVISAVGNDPLGREALDILSGRGLGLSALAVIPDKPTSTVDARIDASGNATYVIHENVAWDAIPASPAALALVARAEAVNFGSLAQRGEVCREITRTLLSATPANCIRVFDVNLRPPFIYQEVLAAGMEMATVVKMNDDELPVIAKLFGWRGDPEAAMEDLASQYPNISHIVVTRGAKGAWWHNRHRLTAKPPPRTVKTVDTIGAGDSVTATVMLGLLKGWEVEKIMLAAMEIASFVCSCRGGMPELPASLKAEFRE